MAAGSGCLTHPLTDCLSPMEKGSLGSNSEENTALQHPLQRERALP